MRTRALSHDRARPLPGPVLLFGIYHDFHTPASAGDGVSPLIPREEVRGLLCEP